MCDVKKKKNKYHRTILRISDYLSAKIILAEIFERAYAEKKIVKSVTSAISIFL